LLIAEAQDAGGFRVVDSFSRIVRLGEGLAANGTLSDAACLRALVALKICAAKVAARAGCRVRAVATEACRRAGNGGAFLDRVAAETGLAFEAISATEEARLTLLGCAPLLDPSRPFALVFDIGGGSTELMWVAQSPADAPRLLGVESLPLGVVTLAETEGCGALSDSAYDALVERLDRHLARFDAAHGVADRFARGDVFVLGTSGTVTTLGGLYLDLSRYDRSRVDGLTMAAERASAIGRDLARMTPTERARQPCIGAERADLVALGCAVLEAICRRWPVKTLRAADRGIREGLLLEMIAADRGRAGESPRASNIAPSAP
jgi:exopolyphosphatase/guanosine-5'-triphosphate,3'-diphosphate pyrophosphatase